MVKISIKISVLMFYAVVLMIIISGCSTDTPPLTSAIFSDVEKIEISPISGPPMSSSSSFIYQLPGEVKYAIVEVF